MRRELKIWKVHFDRILSKRKRVEIRKEDDRKFNVGDELVLSVWDTEKLKFTGEQCKVDVTFVHRGMGMKDQFAALCITEPREVVNHEPK